MSRLFLLCLSIISLICAIQCTPTFSKRSEPSPKPRGLVARGLCYFHCPDENVVGEGLSKSYGDSGRLYCKYDVEGVDDKTFCTYNRNTGELLSSYSPSQCDEQAAFDCSGTKNGQQEMKQEQGQLEDPRSVNLPQFVKKRSMARREVEAEAA